MKNYKKGFASIIIVIVLALGILGFGAYKVFYKAVPAAEESMNISEGNFPADYQPADHSAPEISQTNRQDSVGATNKIELSVPELGINFLKADPNFIYATVITGKIIGISSKILFPKEKGCDPKYGALGAFEIIGKSDLDKGADLPWWLTTDGLQIQVEAKRAKEFENFYLLFRNPQDYCTSDMELLRQAKINITDMIESATQVSSNWKTYKNDKYGFEVKYSSNYSYQEDYSVSESKDPVTKINLGHLASIHFDPSPLDDDKNWLADIYIWNTDFYTLDQLKDLKDYYLPSESVEIIPGGKMYTISYTSVGDAGSGGKHVKTFFIVNDKTGLVYMIANDEMAGSFKFTK